MGNICAPFQESHRGTDGSSSDPQRAPDYKRKIVLPRFLTIWGALRMQWNLVPIPIGFREGAEGAFDAKASSRIKPMSPPVSYIFRSLPMKQLARVPGPQWAPITGPTA